MSTTPAGSSPFSQRWLFFAVFAGTALLAATVVTEGVRAAAPAGSGAHGLGFAVVVYAVTGATLGALAAFRLRAGGIQDESVNLDAAALGVGLAAGAVAAAWLTPLGSTMRMRGALAIWPIAAAGVAGAALAAARGGRGVPLSAADVSRAPLGVGEKAAVEQALAVLDGMQRFHDRVAEDGATRPDPEETERFFDAHERFGERCGLVSSSHAVLPALRESGDALTTAVELYYVAQGWHDDLGVAAGDAEGLAQARRAWGLAGDDPRALAEALSRRARAARAIVHGFVAGARTSV